MSKFLYAFLISAILCILMVQGSMKSEGAEEPTREEMKEMLSKLMENRSKHYRSQKGPHYCGRFAVKKIEEVCPDLCTLNDDTLIGAMCRRHLTDEEIILRCCP
ncbi:hypothetical protein L3Y34_019796 [Caenorhabditis briggsae]|uniref:Uncharacterized protein n=2 Tax=Caenorhabditis briggsae TaxID=6238 RepID=A0AAE9IX76_CAEBR|nr:hypothetical protein L3Y34_019796 [Caenorhabditis briggsae]